MSTFAKIPGRALLIGIEPMLAWIAERELQAAGCFVSTTQLANEALELLVNRSYEVDVLITELAMPEMSGVELARAAGRLRPGLPVVLLTSHALPWTPEQALARGVTEVLPKPFSPNALLLSVERALSLRPPRPWRPPLPA